MTGHERLASVPDPVPDAHLRAFIHGYLQAHEAEALRARLHKDPALRQRFDLLFQDMALDLDWDEEPERRLPEATPEPQYAGPTLAWLRASYEGALTRVLDETLTSVVERLGLSLRRGQILAMAGGGYGARIAALNEVSRQCQSEGLTHRRSHVGLDPFLTPDSATAAENLLVAEGPLAPGWRDVLLVQRAPLAFTAGLRGWSTLASECFVARNYLIPTRTDFDKSSHTTAVLEGLRVLPCRIAGTLGQMGMPVPLPLLARASQTEDEEVRGLLEATGFFSVETDARHGISVCHPVDETLLETLLPWNSPERGAETAMQILNRIITAATPEDTGTIIVLLRSLALTGRSSLARELIVRHLRALRHLWLPESIPAFVWARLCMQIERYDTALEILDRYRIRVPQPPYITCIWAEALVRQGREQEARIALDDLRRHAPPDVYALYTLANLQAGYGQLTEAETALLEAQTLDPGNPYVLTALGDLAVTQQHSAAAEQCFAEALRAAPGSAPVLYRWGKAKARQGQFSAALELLQRAVAIDHWNPSYTLELAGLCKEHGDLASARAYAESVLEIAPQSAEALAILRATETAPALSPAQSGWRQTFRRALTFVLTQLQPLVTSTLETHVALSGATDAEPPKTWEVYEDEEQRMRVVVTSAQANLIVTLEIVSQPVEGVTVILEEITPSGDLVERGRGETDTVGEVNLGPLSAFPPLQAGGRYRLQVAPPSSEAVGSTPC